MTYGGRDQQYNKTNYNSRGGDFRGGRNSDRNSYNDRPQGGNYRGGFGGRSNYNQPQELIKPNWDEELTQIANFRKEFLC